MLTFKEIVEETNQQVFCYFLTENQFESPIRKWINELPHNIYCL